MELVATLAGVAALVLLLRLAALVRVARGLRLRRGESALKDPAELPPYFAALRPPLEAELAALGFSFSHVQLDESPFVGPVSRKWVLVYVNAAASCSAEASLTDIPEPSRVFSVGFVSHFADGFRLLTVSGLTHGIVGALPRTAVVDPYTEDLALQWEAHRTAVSALRGHGAPVALSPVEHARRGTDLQREYVRSLLNADWLDHVGEARFRLRFPAALRVAVRLFRGQGKLTAMLARGRKRRGAGGAGTPLPLEVEIESFRRVSHLQRGSGMGWAAKLGLLVATMALFAVSFGIGSSWAAAAGITAVVLLHEGGHYAGMRLFRYEDVRVLFLPFMGAVTIGRQDRTPPHRRVIVLLLGPVPGIVLGTALLLSPLGAREQVRALALMMLGLNYLNLLPVMPFDGGQIVNVFFARAPLVRALFQAAGGVAIAAAGAALGPDRFLTVLGTMVVVGAIGVLRYRGLVNALGRRLPAGGGERSEEALLPLIFKALHEGGYREKPFKERFQAATYLLQNVPAAAPSARLVVGTALACLAVFAFPIAMMAGRMAMAGAPLLLPGLGAGGIEAPLAPEELKPDPSIRLSADEEELARTLGIATDPLLRLKQHAGGSVVPLVAGGDGAGSAPAGGVAIAVAGGRSEAVVLRLRDELLASGLVLFVDRMGFEEGGERVGLIRSADPFDVLRVKGTDGINYGHTTEQVVARLREWHGRHPLALVGAGRDWVDLELRELPADPAAFAREVYELCPDAVEQGAGSVENLAAVMTGTRRLYLWWD